jgi:hypothetical protein
MESYPQAFPIEVVCSPKAIPYFLDCGFHEVEWHDSSRAVRLLKPDGCEGDLNRIVALAQAGVTLLADIEGDWIVDARMLAAKAGILVELDPLLIGHAARTEVSFADRTIDRNSVARYWDVRLSVERDLGLPPLSGANAAVGRLPIGRSLPSCPTRASPALRTHALRFKPFCL